MQGIEHLTARAIKQPMQGMQGIVHLPAHGLIDTVFIQSTLELK